MAKYYNYLGKSYKFHSWFNREKKLAWIYFTNGLTLIDTTVTQLSLF